MTGRERSPAPDHVERLAVEHGIASEFLNARGEAVPASLAVQTKLLESMGVLGRPFCATTDKGAQRNVMVVKADKGKIKIDMGKSTAGSSIGWEIKLENGSNRSGLAKVISNPASPPVICLADIPCGYHQLRIQGSDVVTSLIVTPGRCWLPEEFGNGEGAWGISLQLYLLRSARNWGIGDFTDLAKFATLAAGHGCDVLGLNPLHQMFPDDPECASPYSPATRYFLNILYIDVEAIPEFADSRAAKALLRSDGFKRSLENCRSADLVAYDAVTTLKMQAFRIAHAEFGLNASTERRRRFLEFVRGAGENLETASLFQVLRSHFVQRSAANADWRCWPEAFRSVTSCQVREFAKSHSGEIEFLNWLQWIADQQLAAAKEVAIRAGMRIGFYRDLAVGCDRTGSETWAKPADFMVGAEIGAPPDILNPSGQNWGLPPFNPLGLQEHGYSPFIDLVRANMRHAGGLRIDHVMGLQRLYCIPQGLPASEGAYVSYPVADLMGILALESHRHRCFVVGEDLGTVPEGFRELMSEANVLSYRVLFFEQAGEAGRFLPPEEYPRLAVAVAGSHDLPTLRGWLTGKDIELKERLKLYSSPEETASQLAMREQERAGVLEILGLDGPATEEVFSRAVHRFLGNTNCALAMTQLDDLLDEYEPVNVPATSTEHPNWRRKYSTPIEDLIADHPAWQLAEIMKAQRGR